MKRVLSTVEQEDASLLANLFEETEEQRLYRIYEEKLNIFKTAKEDIICARNSLYYHVMPEEHLSMTNKYLTNIMQRASKAGKCVVSNLKAVHVNDMHWCLDSFCINQNIFIQRTSFWTCTLTYEGRQYACRVGGCGHTFPHNDKSMERIFTPQVENVLAFVFFAMERFYAILRSQTPRLMDFEIIKKRKQQDEP